MILFTGVVTVPLAPLFAAQFSAAFPRLVPVTHLIDRLSRVESYRWPQGPLTRSHATLISWVVCGGWISAATAAAILVSSILLFGFTLWLGLLVAAAFVTPGLWAIQILIRKYRDAEQGSQERRSLVWIVLGLIVGLWLWYPVAGITSILMPEWLRAVWLQIVFAGSQAALIVCMYSATFWAGSFDPSLVIRRSTLYGTLSLGVVFLSAVIEEALSDLVLPKLGLPNRWSVWITGGFVAVLVASIHNRYSRAIDRGIDWVVSRSKVSG
jgi:hypothetical protein